MGGPIFGASGKINLAYFDALRAMAKMCISAKLKDGYLARAERLRASIMSHLWNENSGIIRMSDITSPNGVCQDINAYGITTGVAPFHPNAESVLCAPEDGNLPLAFQGIERWEEKNVVSPYASGFAAEALFERHYGSSAVGLVERVWGLMADSTNANYSGGHWEAMKPDGTPIQDDTSLMHGWSTWPVYLLPRYLGGLEPIEPGWTRWKCRPILAGLESVDVQLSTPVGEIEVTLLMEESRGTGQIIVTVPSGSVAEVFAPEEWIIVTSEEIADARGLESQTIIGENEKSFVKIVRVHKSTLTANGTASDKARIVATTRGIEKRPTGLSSPEKQRVWFKHPKFLNRIVRWIF
jgi:alpha-L-rhamnosidase